MNKMKLCKNCVHHELNSSKTLSYCNNSKNINTSVNLISGTEYRNYRYTYVFELRAGNYLKAVIYNICGKSGRWFTAK